MADDTATSATDDATTTDATITTDDATATTTTDDGLSDAGRNAIRQERRAAREAQKRANELEAELQEFRDRDKTDLQKLTEERDTFKGTSATLEAENLRLKVALKKGLVGERAFIADRLHGDTEKELLEDADTLLSQLKPADATDFDNGVRTTATSGDMNAAIRAAAGRS